MVQLINYECHFTHASTVSGYQQKSLLTGSRVVLCMHSVTICELLLLRVYMCASPTVDTAFSEMHTQIFRSTF